VTSTGQKPSKVAPVGASGELEGIAVFARLKPVGKSDTTGEVEVTKRFGKQKSVQMRNLEFSLDWIFTHTEPQEDVYNIAAHDRVSAVLGGYNATILAYGQTGSGKTHTMFGPDEVLTDFLGCDPAAHGIVPRASEHLFDGIRHGSADSSFIVQCSYLEIYNNTLNDLLGGKQNLPIREKPGQGLVVEGLSLDTVTTSKEVMDNLARGNSKRVVAAMKMNARSSRGHAIFTMYVKEILSYGGEKCGKLNLVDLAGMESSKKSYAVEGASNNEMRKVEAKNINVSLYALGSVIERLSEAGRKGGGTAHIPYRDSKLTRLLQDSLGGNSKSTIIVALRIEKQNIEESINTLRFAQRAKAVKTIVKDNTITVKNTDTLLKEIDGMNTQLETSQLMIRQLQSELAVRQAAQEEMLAKAVEDAASAAAEEGGGAGSEATQAQVAALQLEVSVMKTKYTSLLHKSILHRVIKAQSESAISKLRDAHEDVVRQLGEAEDLLGSRERENRELAARVEELERVLASGGIMAPPRSGGGNGGGADADAVAFEEWREDTISSAEAELKAAMAAGDPERLKAAIANASSTVAKARARGTQVLKKQQVLHGDSRPEMAAEHTYDHMPTAMDALSSEEREYIRFHEVATTRKLALASRGFEVQNVFIDSLYDIALKEQVPAADWGEFVRLQLPSPRLDDDDDDDGGAVDVGDSSGGAFQEIELDSADGTKVVKKVRKAMVKVTKMFGWRAKMGNVSRTYRQNLEHFGMDQPDEMPKADDDVGAAVDGGAGSGGASLASVATHAATHEADAHLKLLSLTHEGGAASPPPTLREGETRAQAYNRRLRERMEAREGEKGLTKPT
jgi:hypothetical protein